MKALLTSIFNLPVWAHAAVTVASFAGFQKAKAVLDASYSASRHPVDYATGQTTFDAARIKEFYAYMQTEGTLDIYYQTQLIDFAFLILLGLTGLLLGTLVSRAARDSSWARRAGLVAAALFVTGAGMDAFENLTSFVMLDDPSGFADWLALPYSSFAVAKFALITGGMAAIVTSLVLTATGRLIRRPVIG